ncbi:MAG: hydrogen gas-evolving membrane-bound hydrogenase subunit E [Planctomycetota bacterium]
MIDWQLTIPMGWCVAAAVVAWLSMLPGFRKVSGPRTLGAVCGLLTAGAFASAWWLRAGLEQSGEPFAYASWPWVPSLGLSVGVYFDGLSALMAMLVTGIGTAIMVYAGQYFYDPADPTRDKDHRRFLGYLTLFQTAMLGVVMAGDLVLLFVFWELTSVTSFLLIGFKRGDAKARAGAIKSLMVTGGGGVALLIGVLMIGHTAGSFAMPDVLTAGDELRSSPVYFLMLGLLFAGALTKSAQFPFHGWLPDGMTAPTPASAFLHSATMVKAGVFLLARMNPAMGFTETWFWVLTIAGALTMLLGAFMALRVTDLKAVLAYTTLSQLGVLTMLCGQDTAVAFKALMVGLVAHGLYKSSLFMAVGIIDHACGTRDLDRLGNLRKRMPITGVVVGIAALSMAGLPPMFGYLAKDVLLASASHPTLPGFLPVVLAGAVALAGAASLAAAGRIVIEAFVEREPEGVAVRGHDPGWVFWLMPAVPAVFSVIVALPALSWMKTLAEQAAEAAFAASVDVPLKFWKGWSITKVLGFVAIALGLMMVVFRRGVRRALPDLTKDAAYAALVWLVDRPAWLATRLQNGQLTRYVAIMLLGVAALWLCLAWPGDGSGSASGATQWGNDRPWLLLQVAALLTAGSAAFATLVLRRDLQAIFSLGASGLGVALIFLLQPAPDVALVMLVVDVLTVVVLVLALSRVPRAQRQAADRLDYLEKRRRVVRDGGIAVAAAALFGVIVWQVLQARDGTGGLSPWFLANAKSAAGASDVVGAILVDFRAIDTFIEIAVFALAGVGVYTLVRHASPTAGDKLEPNTPIDASAPGKGEELFDTPLMRLLAGAVLPLCTVVAATHVMYGHAQPGDGFTAGVILSLAAGVRYVVLGYEKSRQSKPWLRPVPLVGTGLALAMASATFALLVNGSFFSHVNLSAAMGVPLPKDFAITTSLLFELAIALAVFGGGTLLIDTLTRPEDRENPEDQGERQTAGPAKGATA